MDFRAAPQIRKALRAKVDHGVFGYGKDTEFLHIIKNWFIEEYGAEISEEWIVLLPAIVPVLAAVSRLREGPVLINIPNYHALLEAPIKAGKPTVLSPLKNTNEYYEFDFGDLYRRAEKNINLFFLCNPHNPVGRVYTKNELRELSRFAKAKDLIVISDEAHCGLVFDRPHTPWFTVDSYAAERSITIMGPGKTFNMAGIPFGFAVIPNKKLRGEFEKTCFAMPKPGVLNIAAAKAAYGQSREWHIQAVEYLRNNRDYLENALRSSFPQAKLTHVEGTYLQWIDFRPVGIADPFTWLRDKAKILSNDGKIFGLSGYIRLNFGTQRSHIAEAVERIKAAVG
jgi:cystathionine beta-lyase